MYICLVDITVISTTMPPVLKQPSTTIRAARSKSQGYVSTPPRPPHRRAKTSSSDYVGHTASTISATFASLPTMESFKTMEAEYLTSLTDHQRAKALIDLPLFRDIWTILTSSDEANVSNDTQFTTWVKKMFTIQPSPQDSLVPCNSNNPLVMLLFHNNKPVAVRDNLYEILCEAHISVNHGGRDRTDTAVRSVYSCVPKDLITRFVKICPTCRRKKAGVSRYKYTSWATEDAVLDEGTKATLATKNLEQSEDEWNGVAPDETSLRSRSSLGSRPAIVVQDGNSVASYRSESSARATDFVLPDIVGWTGPAMILPHDQLHLADVARLLHNSNSRSTVSSSSLLYRSESDSQPWFPQGSFNDRSKISQPSRSTSPIHLRPILSQNGQNSTDSTNNRLICSPDTNLPSLHHVIPADCRTGLGIEMRRTVSSERHSSDGSSWSGGPTLMLPPLTRPTNHRSSSYNMSSLTLNDSDIDPALFSSKSATGSGATYPPNFALDCKPSPPSSVAGTVYHEITNLFSANRLQADQHSDSAIPTDKCSDLIGRCTSHDLSESGVENKRILGATGNTAMDVDT